MRKNVLKGRPEWARLRSPEPPRLWRIGYVLAASFLLAVLALAGLGWLALAVLHHPQLPHAKAISVHDAVGVAQLVFASVAGVGALVALVVAYRRQRVAESAAALDRQRWKASRTHDRTQLLNERFAAIAAQLGDDNPAVRLAGVHAMAGLADDWEENRQTCIDVLCAYLRLPYAPDPGPDAPQADQLAFRADREVRHTVIRVIASHLQHHAAIPWQGRFDFTGVVFDGAGFSDCVFSSGVVDFNGAEFVGGMADFRGVQFADCLADFRRVKFASRIIDFSGATFSGGFADFRRAEFATSINFGGATFSGGAVDFSLADFACDGVSFGGAEFSGSRVLLEEAEFTGGTVHFENAKFTGGIIDFRRTRFAGGTVSFLQTKFTGGTVCFGGADFVGGTVDFPFADFSGGTVSFVGARFRNGTVSFVGADFSGGTVSFVGADFKGGAVDFSNALGWSRPPEFDWDVPPAGVKLPATTPSEPQ